MQSILGDIFYFMHPIILSSFNYMNIVLLFLFNGSKYSLFI